MAYNTVKATQNPGDQNPSNATVQAAAVAQVANTVARPGPLTTEWWTVLAGGTVGCPCIGGSFD